MSLCTEARTSLRESMKIFQRIQSSTSSIHHFEDLCFAYSEKSNNSDVYRFSAPSNVSCGNFVKCFTSLFVSKRDINRINLNQIIDGNVLTQYYNNINILLFNHYNENPTDSLSLQSSQQEEYRTFPRWMAMYGYNSLSHQLLKLEKKEQLPRMLVCSITYVFPHHFANLLPSEQENNAINDHKFVIIKHSNDHFQIVQNYIQDDGNSANEPRKSMNLREWQANTENSFSSPLGFNKDRITEFLSYLQQFAQEAYFNNANYGKMFGVRVAGEIGVNRYWPSISYREIDDDVVHGYGHRCMANDLLLTCS